MSVKTLQKSKHLKFEKRKKVIVGYGGCGVVVKRWVLALVLIAIVIVGGAAGWFILNQRNTQETLRLYLLYMQLTRKPGYVEFYSYDPSQPLNAEVTLVEHNETEGYDVYKVTFDSVDRTDVSSRVTAWLVTPLHPREGVGVVLLHGLNSDKNKTLPTAKYFAANNFTCLAIDLPLHGERATRPLDFDSDIVDVMIQAVFDVRRSIDFLEEKYGVEKVALVGRSLGSLIGAVTLGVDGRISVGALIATGGNLTYILHNSEISEDPNVDVDEILGDSRVCYTEPLNYIGNFNGSLQLHYAKNDEVIPPQACLMLSEAATNCKNKQVIEHEGGHNIPDREVNDQVLALLQSDLTAATRITVNFSIRYS
nr:alpha/beta fold hydrolase [Candidatus Bathyarchaeota archaeon]